MRPDLYSDEFNEYQEYLEHVGKSRKDGAPVGSGRYPLGSGENPYQHSMDFLGRVKVLKNQGLSEKEIAEAMGIVNDKGEPYIRGLRLQLTEAKYYRNLEELASIHSLLDEGKNYTEIAKIMGWENESSVRSRLQKEANGKMFVARETADFLKNQLETKGMIDVGKDTERNLGITRTKMDDALYLLQKEGYNIYDLYLPQATNPGQNTTVKVLTKPEIAKKEIFNYDQIQSLEDYKTYDNGESFHPAFVFPKSLDSSRLQVRYAEDGGVDKDGLIELRRGVQDISLGDSTYAQVRILVDGTHYLKGMAAYSDNMPDGVDVIFNTNKPKGTPALGEDKNNTVLKQVKRTKDGEIDKTNPFGSLIKEDGGQSWYDDPNGDFINPKTGKRQSMSLINKRSEEGDWDDWSDTLPSQFLSKQNASLVKKQLKLSISEKELELKEIEAVTNPTLKKKLLMDYANDCDKTSVHLEAASMPRQKYQVIIPLTSISDKEVYAPNYNDGEKVALIRYPHGGLFEIPILTVNNSNKEGIETLSKHPHDAIGINKKVANILSGADFDGDTVMVIPVNENNRIKNKEPFKELQDFDPSVEYAMPAGKKTSIDTQKQMGVISNLITDMTIKGANDEELIRAVKHSMVVIDAEKHNYDWKKSEIDNKIEDLKRLYQKKNDGSGGYGGASTLISRAKSKVYVDKRQGSPTIGEDGSLVYKTATDDKLYYQPMKKDKKTGEWTLKTKRDKETGEIVPDIRKHQDTSTKMAETKDARTLISEINSPIENLYADYANTMKSLANKARLEVLNTGKIQYNKEVRKEYQKEVEHLESELDLALRNNPRERRAQRIANSVIKAKKSQYKDLTDKEIKKISQQALTDARIKVGAKRHRIKISDREWEAIQKGAFNETTLNKILNYADQDELRTRSTPKRYTTLSDAKINKLKSLNATGLYSIAEMAEIMNVSASTIRKYTGKKGDKNEA